MGRAPRWFGAQDVFDRVSPNRARGLIERVLLNGFDPAADLQRIKTPAGAGYLLLMPSAFEDWVGIKVTSAAPNNPAQGLPRIQANYVLMDAATLTPKALIEGASLTQLRTPAVSAVAADRLAAPNAKRMVLFGTGPQALGHIDAIAAIRDLAHIAVVGRSPEKVAVLLQHARGLRLPAYAGTVDDVASADIIVCATSSEEPLFDGSSVREGACVVAVGSHEPEKRELEAELMGRSFVVVEDTGTALREAGDVIMAHRDGAMSAESLTPLHHLVRGVATRRVDAPNVFKGVGMSWQDLAIAIGVADAGAA